MNSGRAITRKTVVNLVPANADKCTRSRLAHFRRWQKSNTLPWHDPNLARYRDDMLASGKARSTVAAYLSTVRACYRAVITDNAIRQMLFDQAAQEIGLDAPADRKAWVDEVLTRIQSPPVKGKDK